MPPHFEEMPTNKKIALNLIKENENLKKISNMEIVELDIEKYQESQEEIVDTLFFKETVNKEAIDYLCNFSYEQLRDIICDEVDAFDETGKEFNKKTYIGNCIKYFKEMKDNNYSFNRKYRYSQHLEKYKKGRIFSTNFSVQSLQHKLRGFILKGLWHDYDMINAHPSILLQMIKNEDNDDIEIMYLENYVKNRKKILTKNDFTKLDILTSINCDKIFKTKNEFLKGFDKEIKKIQDYFHNKYSETYHQTNEKNPKGSLLNKLLCIEENRILQKIINYCKNNQIKICNPMFDGLLINKTGMVDEFNKITINDGVKWSIKPHDNTIFIDEDELANPMLYINVKQEFEKEHFIIENPFMYCREYIDQNGVKILQTFKHSQKKSFQDLTARFEIEGTKKPVHILDTWLKDTEKRSYEKLDFLPPPLECGSRTYNMYNGMDYEKWTETYNDDTNIDNILNHIKLLAGDDKNEECADYLTKYLAHLIQRPGELTRTSLVLFSKQGRGKNMFFDGIANILGLQYVKITTDLKNDITGRFADNSKKFITVLGESQTHQAFQDNEKIKSLITDQYINLEQKGKDTIYNIHNTSRFIFFGNNENIVKVEHGDRRFQPFKITCDKPSNEYFQNLYKDLNDKSVLLKFVDYLKNIDISNFDFENNRVKTSYYDDLKKVNIPILARFLQTKFDDSEDLIKIASTSFFKSYKNYLSKYHREIDYSIRKFGTELHQYSPAISKKKSNGIIVYTIESSKLIQFLKDREYYEEIEIDNSIQLEDLTEI